jgi:serine/threonine-protein kinase RsbW
MRPAHQPSRRGPPIVTDHDAPPYAAGTLPASRSSVPALRERVVGFAREHGVTDDVRARLALTVTEAGGNVVLHAYAPGEEGTLHFAVDIEGEDLQVVIADEGWGIRTHHRSDGLGLGLRLVAQLSSDFGIRSRDPSGVEIWMRFVLDAPAVSGMAPVRGTVREPADLGRAAAVEGGQRVCEGVAHDHLHHERPAGL